MSNSIVNKRVKLKPSVTHVEFAIAVFGYYDKEYPDDYLSFKEGLCFVEERYNYSFKVFNSDGQWFWFTLDQIEAMFDIEEE